jgi:hypothetical protein
VVRRVVALKLSISAATSAASAAGNDSQIGLAHQSQRNEQLRDAAMLRLK